MTLNQEIVKEMKESITERQKHFDGLHDCSPEEYRKILTSPEFEGLPFARSYFHMHTDKGSPKDASLTTKQYVKRAAEYGARVLTVTDHGSMYGIPFLEDSMAKFFDKRKNNGNDLFQKQYIGVGCEFYVCEDINVPHTDRRHLIMYALDDAGYETLCRLVTESNYRIATSRGGQTYPCINKELLLRYVSRGSIGHGHVILTSACIGGVIAAIAFQNENNQAEMEATGKAIMDLQASVMIYKREHPEANGQSIITDPGTGKVITIKDAEEKINQLTEKLNSLTQIAFDPSEMKSIFTQEVRWYDELAGHGNWYMEMQNHGISTEQIYMPMLAQIAHEQNIPLVAANDCHMLNKEDAEVRAYLNAMRFGGQWKGMKQGDDQLYMKTDRELFQWLRMILSEDDAFAAMMGRDEIARRMTFVMKKANHYPKYYE